MSSPYWPHRTPENRRRAYPKYKGDGTADVVVIGAGLTGCTSAYTLAAAGLNVIVLEADRLAGGETGGGLGMIVPEPDAVFRAVKEARGRKVAKLAWQEAQRAAIDFAATLKKLDISCDLKPTATHLNAFTFADGDPLKRELAARKAAALDGAWVPPVSAKRTLSTESFGARRLRGGATYVAGRAAQSDVTVLINGETGTGKELLAKAIHFNSPRRERPFVAINCGAIPRELLESELFGHLKRSFTGAIAHKKGRVETADGGTLFLDEIGEMPAELQVKLLRVIQEREIEKLGSTEPMRVAVRVVAATHRNLAVIPVELPPLRERACDIPDLVNFFFDRGSSCRLG